MSKEKFTGRRKKCWWKFSAKFFFIDDILFLPAKVGGTFHKCFKFICGNFQRHIDKDIDDIMLFPAERRWNFPLIIYICLQNVDGNFHRHLFLPIEDIDDILLLSAKVGGTFH